MGIDTIPNTFPDNCTGRTVDALEAGGVNLNDPFLLGMTPIPFPASLQRSLQNLVNQDGATSIVIPQGGPVPPGLEVFNPISNN